MNQVKVAKELAKHLKTALSKTGQDMSHGAALEVVAKAMGARNWHAFLTEQQLAPPQSPSAAPWSPLQGPMSPAQYLTLGGNNCPVCGSAHDLESGRFESDSTTAWREVTCQGCGAVWTEDFNLVGWTAVNEAAECSSETLTDAEFLQAVYSWLAKGQSVFEDDQQMLLDDLIYDCQIAGASDVNNEGALSQLTHLLKDFGSRDGLVNRLSEYFKISLGTLKL